MTRELCQLLLICMHAIYPSNHCSLLGVELDARLNLHIHELQRKTLFGIRIPLKARYHFGLHALYYAIIHSHPNYFITSLGQAYHSHLCSLQHVQHQAICIITRSNRRPDVTELHRDTLHY